MKLLVSIRSPVNKNGLKTFNYAYNLAEKLGAYIVVCHIIPKEFEMDKTEIIKNTTKKIGKKTEVVIEFDSLLDGLNKVVNEIKPDILVMGSHKRNFLEDLLNDTIDMDLTKEIIKKIDCPILISK